MMKRTIRDSLNDWRKYYKPMIKLLMKQENGHYAAVILVFCCVEHVYRAINGIPATCRKDYQHKAIEYVMRVWTEHYNQNVVEMREIQNENMTLYAKYFLRPGVFNRLKHVGYLTEIVGEEYDYLNCHIGDHYRKDEFSGFTQPITKLMLTNEQNIFGNVSQSGSRNEHTIDAVHHVKVFVSGIDAAYDKAISEME